MEKVSINTSFHQPDKAYYIEPMLLIPFVENAFKHGTGMIEQTMIEIELSAQNNVLVTVTNKYNEDPNEVKIRHQVLVLPMCKKAGAAVPPTAPAGY